MFPSPSCLVSLSPPTPAHFPHCPPGRGSRNRKQAPRTPPLDRLGAQAGGCRRWSASPGLPGRWTGSRVVHTPRISGLSPGPLDPPSKKEERENVSFRALIFSTWAGTAERTGPAAGTQPAGVPVPLCSEDPTPLRPTGMIQEASASLAFLTKPPLPICHPRPASAWQLLVM